VEFTHDLPSVDIAEGTLILAGCPMSGRDVIGIVEALAQAGFAGEP